MSLDLEIIRTHKPSIIGLDEIYHGAVCIPLIKVAQSEENPTGFNILFEIRSENIEGQPGDVCLPGGGLEEGETPQEAAIRECIEELCIDNSQIEIIGQADIFHRDTAIIYPFVAELKDYKDTFSQDEVAKVFQVPLQFLMDTEPERYMVDAKVIPRDDFPFERIKGGRNYKWRNRTFDELFYDYNGITIWGMTARIIYSFVKGLSQFNNLKK